jgi:quercetin dioxygenase-like cupin family protein
MRTTEKIETLRSGKRRYYPLGQKDYATFLQTSEETGGERTLIEIELSPGGGNQPHYHLTYDEHFEVPEGALEVQLGKASRTLRPGE